MAETFDKRWIELSQVSELVIEGNATTPVYITARVENDVPYVDFIFKDERLRLHYDFKYNDVIEVDFEKRKVFINKKLNMNVIDLEYADFFRLDMGVNEFRTVPAMSIDVKYHERSW